MPGSTPAAAPASNDGAVLSAPARPTRLAGLPRRRRPVFAALGVGVVALGAAVTVSLVAGAGAHTAVLAVARPVPVGGVLSAADLTVARVPHHGALAPVAAGDRSRIVGQRAAVTLTPGSLLTPADVTTRPVPASGEQLVAVALKPGQLPATGLRAGNRVLVVVTPGEGSGGSTPGRASGSTSAAGSTPMTATVHAASPSGQDGSVVVDLLATGSDGVTIAQESSTGQVALVQLPAGG
jgi:hypothetical protein